MDISTRGKMSPTFLEFQVATHTFLYASSCPTLFKKLAWRMSECIVTGDVGKSSFSDCWNSEFVNFDSDWSLGVLIIIIIILLVHNFAFAPADCFCLGQKIAPENVLSVNNSMAFRVNIFFIQQLHLEGFKWIVERQIYSVLSPSREGYKWPRFSLELNLNSAGGYNEFQQYLDTSKGTIRLTKSSWLCDKSWT